uniref:Hexosyltransferase n=1 Tax=Clytia hemisphaerica TaxID=252671 RepID=A0A7M5XCJ4_9CNID
MQHGKNLVSDYLMHCVQYQSIISLEGVDIRGSIGATMRTRYFLSNSVTLWKMAKVVLGFILVIIVLINLNISLVSRTYTHKSLTSIEVTSNEGAAAGGGGVGGGRQSNHERKLVLAELAEYYEKLLQQKGVDTNAIKQAMQQNSGKVFNVFNDPPKAKLTNTATDKPLIKESQPKSEVPNKAKTTFASYLQKRISTLPGDNKIRYDELGEKNVYKGLIVDWWFDMCVIRESSDPIWHPLYPRVPQHTSISLRLMDQDRILDGSSRRVYGYLFVKDDQAYDFKLSSRDGAEALLYDTGVSMKKIQLLNNDIKYDKSKEMMHLKLTKDVMDEQDKKIQLSEMFQLQEKNVNLKGDRVYMIEVFQGGKYFTKYSLKWRKSGDDSVGFTTLDDKNLFFKDGMKGRLTPSLLKQKYNPPNLQPMSDGESRRLSFYKYSVLESNEKARKAGMTCDEVQKDYKIITHLYEGYRRYTYNILSYPDEYFKYGLVPRWTSLSKEEAIASANQLFKKLNKLHNGDLELVSLAHVQRNAGPQAQRFHENDKTHYFIELDVRKKSDSSKKIYRASHFMQPTDEGDLCFMKEWNTGKKDVEVNLLTPIKNQKSWLNYMILMLEEIMEQTKETNVILNLIDYNSTDGNYEQILKSSKLKYKYLNPVRDTDKLDKEPVKFNKVKALNYGIKHVENENSIIFILDLHLQLPLNIFDRIKKMTVQGRTSYNPTLLKLACGEHEEYTKLEKSEWLDYGTGMMAMYKNDWEEIGCYNEKLFGTKWGGEDWEVMDRMVAKGYYIVHQRLPRFYHLHHGRAGMWI